MTRPRQVKVHFRSRGGDTESAWCVPLAKAHHFRVDNILFLRPSPTYGDVIEARRGDDGEVSFKRLVKASGRFVMIVDYPRRADFARLVRFFRTQEVVTEGLCGPGKDGSPGRIYLAVPKGTQAKKLFALAAAQVPGLIGVHPRLGPPPPPRKAVVLAPAPPTLFDAIDRKDVKAIQRAKRSALEAASQDGRSLLFVATRDGRLEIVRALLARGVNPNPRSKKDPAPLYAAAMRNRAREAKLLLAAGAKPELAKDRDGDVALVVAAFREELAVLRVLLGTGPSVAHLSHALLEAAGVGNLTIVKLLLAHGADPDWVSARGHSARSVAKQRRRREVLALFPPR